MFWFDKENQEVTFMDNRELDTTLSDGRKLIVAPDILADFREMPFEDNSFYLVVFDPPHLKTGGDKSWLIQKYGRLNKDWPEDLKQGFNECMRVLKPNGTLIFKWNEEQIKLSEVLKCFSQQPLFGNKRAKTHWLVFMKLEG
ncbi:SAM-dependent methyltransferase [Staphylococcus hominis]